MNYDYPIREIVDLITEQVERFDLSMDGERGTIPLLGKSVRNHGPQGPDTHSALRLARCVRTLRELANKLAASNADLLEAVE